MTANTAAGRVASSQAMLVSHAQIVAWRYSLKHTLYRPLIVDDIPRIPSNTTLLTDATTTAEAKKIMSWAQEANVGQIMIGVSGDLPYLQKLAPHHTVEHVSPYRSGVTSVTPLPTAWYCWSRNTPQKKYTSPGVRLDHAIQYDANKQDWLPSVIRLIADMTSLGDVVWDPFCASTKYLLAATIVGRQAICGHGAAKHREKLQNYNDTIIDTITTEHRRAAKSSYNTLQAITTAQTTPPKRQIMLAYSPFLSKIERRAVRLFSQQKITKNEIENMLTLDEVMAPVRDALTSLGTSQA